MKIVHTNTCTRAMRTFFPHLNAILLLICFSQDLCITYYIVIQTHQQHTIFYINKNAYTNEQTLTLTHAHARFIQIMNPFICVLYDYNSSARRN